MKNDWLKLSVNDFDVLVKAREQLHQAVQLVGLVPRSLHPADAGDKYGSLLWSDEHHGLISQTFGENHQVCLNFVDFALVLLEGEKELSRFELDGQTFEESIEWIATQLAKLEYDAEKLNAELPYEIPKYDTADEAPFQLTNADAHKELMAYFSNTNAFLQDLVKKDSRASEVRCWPHHFDIATLITLEAHEDPEEAKSIGVGLSPGDEGSREPYFYITPWPYPVLDHSELPDLSVGHWQEEGWTGLLIKASEVLVNSSAESQREATLDTLNTAHNYFEKTLTT